MNDVNKWQLFYLAQSLTRAKQLEKHREEWFESLYETIIYPSAQLDPMLERGSNPSTEAQAIRIIDLKERYDGKVQREYDRHVRWNRLLEWVNDNDRIILIRYFQKKKSVHPKIINRILTSIERKLDAEEKRIEGERDKEAQKDFQAFMQNKRTFKKVIPSPVEETKRKYLIGGKFVYMTEEEYATASGNV